MKAHHNGHTLYVETVKLSRFVKEQGILQVLGWGRRVPNWGKRVGLVGPIRNCNIGFLLAPIVTKEPSNRFCALGNVIDRQTDRRAALVEQ